MDSIYSNVFDFLESQEDDRIILSVSPKIGNKPRISRTIEPPVNVDFIISKDDIDLTLKKMMDYYIEVEEYEKCAEILKLQNEKDNPKPKKTTKRKPKKI